MKKKYKNEKKNYIYISQGLNPGSLFMLNCTTTLSYAYINNAK